MPALDQEADDAGPLRLPGFVERVWRLFQAGVNVGPLSCFLNVLMRRRLPLARRGKSLIYSAARSNAATRLACAAVSLNDRGWNWSGYVPNENAPNESKTATATSGRAASGVSPDPTDSLPLCCRSR